MLWIYRIVIWLYRNAAYVLSLKNEKAKRFIEGRKAQESLIDLFPEKRSTRYWIHAASLGEFEQARPLIEALKSQDPDFEIVLTFFSPSGFEVRKNYELADYVLYLPIDSVKNAHDFLNKTRPDLAIFVKYEIWYFYLRELQKRKTPTIFISALFRQNQFYFHLGAGFMRKALRGVNYFFVQGANSKKLLESIGIDKVSITGDTRLDSVVGLAEKKVVLPSIEEFIDNKPLIIFGSVWPSDMKVCEAFILSNLDKFKFIIAPHNIIPSEIDKLSKLPKSFKYSEIPPRNKDLSIMIIDNIGLLSSLYRYAHVAYVGGGFNGTLHNTMEAAVYGIPVIWGRHANNIKFVEAAGLQAAGGGFEVANVEDLKNTFDSLDREDQYNESAKAAKQYVYEGTGATAKIMNQLAEIL
ncbi:MAG: glycosyltransferase N-terminal domain-containing protein [Cyclobacteriaceae bacterium]